MARTPRGQGSAARELSAPRGEPAGRDLQGSSGKPDRPSGVDPALGAEGPRGGDPNEVDLGRVDVNGPDPVGPDPIGAGPVGPDPIDPGWSDSDSIGADSSRPTPGGPGSGAVQAAPRVTIDEGTRLSASRLWQMQRQFFHASGVEAWTRKGVPTYITTNPFIARAYARIACAFLDDVQAVAASAGESAAAPKLRVVELGAGTGRFAYHFVTAARALLERAGYPESSLTYVLTDFTETNIELWSKHPKLAPLIEAGLVDLARFDAAYPGPLELRASGEVVGSGDAAQPLVVIANYVLDSIPHDMFALQAGELFEELLTMTAPEGWSGIADVELLPSLELSWERQPLADGAASAYPEDPELCELLSFYAEHLSSTSFLVPTAPVDCLRYFRSVAEPLLMLVGDRGYHRLEDVLTNPGMQMGLHGGAFSLPVNGHALSWYAERHDGMALHPAGGHSSLDVSAFLFGLDDRAGRRTRDAYLVSIDEQGPDDWFYLREVVLRSLDSLSLPELLAALRCSAYDPGVFRELLPRLITAAESAPDDVQPDLYRMLELVFANHFEVPGGYDLAFDVASLLYGMGSYEEALVYLDRSEAEFGPHPSTSFNRGMCYWHLHRLTNALQSMEDTLAFDPSFDRARGMRVTITGALARLPSSSR